MYIYVYIYIYIYIYVCIYTDVPLGCLWDVVLISILKYVLKWLPVGTSKLINDTDRWTGTCVIQLLLEGRSETMIHQHCGSRKHSTDLCFSIGGADAKIPALFHTWGVEVSWSVLWCAESLQDWGVFFILVKVRLCDAKKIP